MVTLSLASNELRTVGAIYSLPLWLPNLRVSFEPQSLCTYLDAHHKTSLLAFTEHLAPEQRDQVDEGAGRVEFHAILQEVCSFL